jgi:hypothetical protein
MKNEIILDLCGGTGAWSAPYKEAGYDVRLITLPGEDVRCYKPPKGVYGILAAPPCTMFSMARQQERTREQMMDAMMIIKACLMIIWNCAADETLQFWALENPWGRLIKYLGKPAFYFEQWQFGDAGKKPTCLWGNFKRPDYTQPFVPGKITSITNPKPIPGRTREQIRAITPPGFAKAFFEANQ